MNPIIQWVTTNALALLAVLLLAAGAAALVQTLRLAWLQAEVAQGQAELEVARGANRAWQDVSKAAERARTEAEAARKKQAEQAARALAEAEQAAEQAEQDLAEFKRRWGRKPASCAVALTQMEAACAGSLSDY